jgi:hypothetical protein
MPARQYHCWDDLAHVNADHMASWGAFKDGTAEIIEFDDREPAMATYELQPDGDSFKVLYDWTSDDGERSLVRCQVQLERRPCRFGGSRVYFIAPCCGRRVLNLALRRPGPRCWSCGKITWASRREGKTRRLIRKADKIAQRIGARGWWDVPRKPERMRHKTYELLRIQQITLAREINRRISLLPALQRLSF